MSFFAFIRSNVPIEDVVRDYVSLKPAGHYLKGFSPFKHEKTPSFTVSPGRGIYYCFSTGNGGDVIDFVSKMENCTQGEAAQILIDRFHLKIPESLERGKQEKKREVKEAYLQCCSLFAQWCSEQLAKAAEARRYLLDRNLTAETITSFMLGYCPGNQEALERFLSYTRAQGILASDLVDAHIVSQGTYGFQFSFDERIIFPICDHMGRICGFGARVFHRGDDRPKYINSRDHDGFNKKQLLYGLHRAKKSIQNSSVVYLVEGYMDCIAMIQSGYTNTVATLGTACTQEHLQLLHRYCHTLIAMYDGDEAGQKAILRLTQLCWNSNLDIGVLTLPEDHDPASFLAAHKTLAALGSPQDLFAFSIHALGTQFVKQPVARKIEGLQQIIQLISLVHDQLRQQMLLQQAAATFDVPLALLQRELYTAFVQNKNQELKKTFIEKKTAPTEPTDVQVKLDILEQRLFSVIINAGVALCDEERQFLQLHFSEPLRQMFILWQNSGECFEEFYARLEGDDRQLVSHCVALQTEKASQETFKELFAQMQRKRWKELLKDVKIKLAQAEQCANAEEKRRIMDEFQKVRTSYGTRG